MLPRCTGCRRAYDCARLSKTQTKAGIAVPGLQLSLRDAAAQGLRERRKRCAGSHRCPACSVGKKWKPPRKLRRPRSVRSSVSRAWTSSLNPWCARWLGRPKPSVRSAKIIATEGEFQAAQVLADAAQNHLHASGRARTPLHADAARHGVEPELDHRVSDSHRADPTATSGARADAYRAAGEWHGASEDRREELKRARMERAIDRLAQ
jgi:hypothetical protein